LDKLRSKVCDRRSHRLLLMFFRSRLPQFEACSALLDRRPRPMWVRSPFGHHDRRNLATHFPDTVRSLAEPGCSRRYQLWSRTCSI